MINIKENEKLSEYTTFRVGGPARYFVSVKTEQELMETLAFAKQKELEVFVLGGGSNVLVSDSGFDGLVVHNQIKGIELDEAGSVAAMSGDLWDDLVRLSVDKNLAGIECLSRVPGSAGGAIVQNIGCYGQTLSDTVNTVTVIDLVSLEKKTYTREECKFEYRGSIFKNNPGKFFVLKFHLNLVKNGKPTIKYHDIVQRFANNPNPSLQEVRHVLIEIRASKGMVIDDCHEIFKSVGSFFKNPVVSKKKFESVKQSLEDSEIAGDWYWEVGAGNIKIAAARVLQKSGFPKGYSEENVGVSPKQPLAIINLGSAKASEIKNFAEKIKNTVKQKFGIALEEEALYVGNF